MPPSLSFIPKEFVSVQGRHPHIIYESYSRLSDYAFRKALIHSRARDSH